MGTFWTWVEFNLNCRRATHIAWFTLTRMKTVSLHGNSSSSDTSVNTEMLSRTGFTVLAVIMGVFSVVGIILNVLVIVVTVRHRQLRQPLSYALVNLAICDLGCAMFGGLPTTLTSAMGYFSLGRVGCVLEAFAVAFFGKFWVVCMSVYYFHHVMPYCA